MNARTQKLALTIACAFAVVCAACLSTRVGAATSAMGARVRTAQEQPIQRYQGVARAATIHVMTVPQALAVCSHHRGPVAHVQVEGTLVFLYSNGTGLPLPGALFPSDSFEGTDQPIPGFAAAWDIASLFGGLGVLAPLNHGYGQVSPDQQVVAAGRLVCQKWAYVSFMRARRLTPVGS